MNDHVARTHEEIREDLPEYALGILDGRERSEVLTHVEGCAECAEELAALTATTDVLLHLPVGAEPPVGFESRTIELIRRESPTALRTRRRLPALLGAAAAVAALTFGVGWALGGHGATTPPPASASAVVERPLSSGSHEVGMVYAVAGKPAWMFVSLKAPGAPSVVRCVVVTTSGDREVIGSFSLDRGSGSWGVSLPVALASVRTVELTSTSGAVVARLADSAWRAGGASRTY
jgi:hypothetical protein